MRQLLVLFAMWAAHRRFLKKHWFSPWDYTGHTLQRTYMQNVQQSVEFFCQYFTAPCFSNFLRRASIGFNSDPQLLLSACPDPTIPVAKPFSTIFAIVDLSICAFRGSRSNGTQTRRATTSGRHQQNPFASVTPFPSLSLQRLRLLFKPSNDKAEAQTPTNSALC